MEKQPFHIPLNEIEIHALPSQGAGGQNVNKVATAIHLRFDIVNSSLPKEIKTRLLQRSDHRITREGVIIIKSQSHRTQERNKIDALNRLNTFICLSTSLNQASTSGRSWGLELKLSLVA